MSNSLPAAFASVLAAVEKKQGNVIFTDDLPVRGKIPFSSPYLNEITRGGFPRGVSNEIVGEPHTGKSTLATDQIKHYLEISMEEYQEQKKSLEEAIKSAKTKPSKDKLEAQLEVLHPKLVVYVDLEWAVNPEWMKKLGVDVENDSRIFYYRPPNIGAEDALDVVIDMMATGDVGMIVIDSVGVMVSTAEHEGEMGKGNYGGISKPLTKFYKKATPLMGLHNVLTIVINQSRADMGGYGRLVRPGGKMHEFAQSTTLWLKPSSGHIYEEGYKKGSGNSDLEFAKGIAVRLDKLKQASARVKNTFYTIRPGYGIDRIFDTFQFAIELGYIAQTGAYFTFTDPLTGEVLDKKQGTKNAVIYLEENPELVDKLWDACYNYSITDQEG